MAKAKKRTAIRVAAPMLAIDNTRTLAESQQAIVAVLSLPNQAPETLAEAMRTLAVIAKPPANVTVQNCTFDARRRK